MKSKELSERSLRTRLQRAVDRIHSFLSVEDDGHEESLTSQIMMVVSSRCNQQCPFCQAYRTKAEEGPALDDLKRASDRIAGMLPGSKIILTGGEPTLREDLQELVDYLLGLKEIGLVELQTNAVLIGSRPERFDFAPSKRLRFLVAMHGLRENIYDRCTGTRGMLPSALEGTRRLLEQGHQVEFNYVVNKLNLSHMEEYISALPTLAEGKPPAVHFSIMGAPVQPSAVKLFVRFSDFLKHLQNALKLAEEQGVEARVALSAWHMAIPLCILGDDLRQFSDFPRMYDHEASDPYADPEQWWVKGPGCTKCKIEEYCLGLPRSYADRFGFDELEPIG